MSLEGTAISYIGILCTTSPNCPLISFVMESPVLALQGFKETNLKISSRDPNTSRDPTLVPDWRVRQAESLVGRFVTKVRGSEHLILVRHTVLIGRLLQQKKLIGS